MADGIEAADWELTGGYNPDHNITCIPFDQSCHHLYRSWETPEPISLPELVDSTGYNLEIGTVYRSDCAEGYDGRIRIRLCLDGNEIDLHIND
jgi:hypothetical protein